MQNETRISQAMYGELPASTVALGKLSAERGDLGLREQVIRRPRAGEVTLQVLAAGICGTDLHIADNEYPSEPPVTMGHEVTGVVVALGDGVGRNWLGTRVAAETFYSVCEVCRYCRSGRPNLCPDRRSIGTHVDGAFASHLTLPARNLHELPRHVGELAGVLAEPLACVANALLNPSQVGPADTVAVIGPGTIGLLAAQVARSAGGSVVVLGLERDRIRLEVAKGEGFEIAVVPDDGDDLPSFDVVCECSGSESGANLALELVRRAGAYVQLGIFGRPVTVDLDRMLYKELTYSTGFASTPSSWENAISLLESHQVSFDALVTEAITLEHWETAFGATRLGQGLKYLLIPV